ncbi:MAG TPA: hypothetical protein VNC50_10150 [Planctomycetia bacterium]|jgi:hypothetical protein|nr:hypothetical protein [Planctomycetia bacterium]
MSHEKTAEDYGPQEIQAGKVALVGVFGAVVTFGLMAATQVFFFSVQKRRLEGKHLDKPDVNLVSAVATQREQIEGYRYVDQKNGVVTIPVARAMEKVLEARKAGGQPAFKDMGGVSAPAAPPPAAGAAPGTPGAAADPQKPASGTDSTGGNPAVKENAPKAPTGDAKKG